jgi:hypothetical protein
MAVLPTPDAYNDAVQSPRRAFSDSSLASGTADCNGFGIPKALGGGFAITYRITANGKAYAVRCFHKQVKNLQDSYRLIHTALNGRRLSSFVPFEYQPLGIRVKGTQYPIVKMEWASGATLGEYVDANHRSSGAMSQLRAQFQSLESELATHGIAHGDLQNGNVIVDKGNLRLVDYDGMFVPGMQQGAGHELGHKHFQHPLRQAADFGPTIDRFSFLVIHLSLWALSLRPDLFGRFSTGENILFSANDYCDPQSSDVFRALQQEIPDPAFQRSLSDFAALCKAGCKTVPRLKDFLSRTTIPTPARTSTPATPQSAAYIGALPVVDAASFAAVSKWIGDRIELVGQVVEVKNDKTRKGKKPYTFINFRHWRDDCVRAIIWSEGLAALGYTPDSSWVGKWIVVNGMVDPVYEGQNRFKTIKYRAVGISVSDRSQIHVISQQEAHWRLGKGPRPVTALAPKSSVSIPGNIVRVLSQPGTGGVNQPTIPPSGTPTSHVPPIANPIPIVVPPQTGNPPAKCTADVLGKNAKVLAHIGGISQTQQATPSPGIQTKQVPPPTAQPAAVPPLHQSSSPPAKSTPDVVSNNANVLAQIGRSKQKQPTAPPPGTAPRPPSASNAGGAPRQPPSQTGTRPKQPAERAHRPDPGSLRGSLQKSSRRRQVGDSFDSYLTEKMSAGCVAVLIVTAVILVLTVILIATH